MPTVHLQYKEHQAMLYRQYFDLPYPQFAAESSGLLEVSFQFVIGEPQLIASATLTS